MKNDIKKVIFSFRRQGNECARCNSHMRITSYKKPNSISKRNIFSTLFKIAIVRINYEHTTN